MNNKRKKMDEKILVCVYYGPNGERLIQRGGAIANFLNCPFYILTVDPSPEDDLDIEKSNYISRWEHLAHELEAQEFIVKYNEKRKVAEVIGEVCREKHITQIVLGQTAQSRWREITKGSLINVLLDEIPFVDLHIVSVSRELKNQEGYFEKGVRAYLVKENNAYQLSFNHNDDTLYEGIFYKEVGTDFDNGVFKFMKNNQMLEVHITDGNVAEIQDLLKP